MCHVHCGLGQLSPLPTSGDDKWVAAKHCGRAKRSRISDTHRLRPSLQFRYINNQSLLTYTDTFQTFTSAFCKCTVICACIRMYVCVDVCVHICMYVYAYMCVYVYAYIKFCRSSFYFFQETAIGKQQTNSKDSNESWKITMKRRYQ